jgi:CubicO group peptidase (beta-lactamase class C family)
MLDNLKPLPPDSQNPGDAAISGAMDEARMILNAEALPKVPGLSIEVSIKGKTVWTEQFGFTDLVAKKKVSPSTRFRIASVSKPFTAAGLALLVERGLVDLDAPIQKYIPDFPRKEGEITTRMLASHLSGIRHYRDGESIHSKPVANLRDGLRRFEDDPLEHMPGATCKYSSYGYNIIGVIMENVSGKSYLDYMAENVFQPLGMTNTLPDIAGANDPQRSIFYETDGDGGFVIAPAVDYSATYPAGGFLSTSSDLAKFGSAHLKPGFLKAESLKLMFTSNLTVDGEPNKYGMGWFLGNHLHYHGGDNVGGSSMLVLQPQTGVVVSFVANCNQFLLRSLIHQGKAPESAREFILDKKLTAQIAVIFAKAVIKANQP